MTSNAMLSVVNEQQSLTEELASLEQAIATVERLSMTSAEAATALGLVSTSVVAAGHRKSIAGAFLSGRFRVLRSAVASYEVKNRGRRTWTQNKAVGATPQTE